eukprot:SAG31_NODE_10485_length_1132_cov_2.338819_2_plen_189_part_01
MDWSNIWYNEMPGESHLLIVPDAEHSLATGLPEVLSSLGTFVASILAGHTQTMRPHFDFTYDQETGELVVTVPATSPKPTKVWLQHAQTLQTHRRDFRWVRMASNTTGACTLPGIPLSKPLFGGNCLQPILWHNITLEPQDERHEAINGDVVYRGVPPRPSPGRWTGYYVELCTCFAIILASEINRRVD